MIPYKLSYNYKDLFKSPRIALSGKKIWVFLIANLFGYASYWLLTYTSILISGTSLNDALTLHGLYPSIQGYKLSVLSYIFFYSGIFLWFISNFLASAAVNRITLKQLKGNEFYSTTDSWNYVKHNWKSITFPPIVILFIIILFIFFAWIFGLLGSIPYIGHLFISLPFPVYFFGSLFTIYSIFVLSTSINLSPSIVSLYEEDTMGVVFQSYSITWSQPWRLLIYNSILFPIILFSFSVFSWFWLNSLGFIIFVFGHKLTLGNVFLNSSNYAINFVSPPFLIELISQFNFNFSLELSSFLLFPIFENINFINPEISSPSFSGLILAIFYFLIGLSIFSYLITVFSVGQAFMFIIFKMKSDDDNILERKDQEELEDEKGEDSLDAMKKFLDNNENEE